MAAAVVLAAIVVGCSVPVWAENLAPNPSFEMGTTAPDGWRVAAGVGEWIDRAAMFDHYCLAVTGPGMWAGELSDVMQGDPQGYRLSGWVRAEGGAGRLELVLGDVDQVVVRTPAVTSPRWTYVAVDVPPAMVRERAPSIVFCAAERGRACFDGVRLTPLGKNILPNTEFIPRKIEDKPLPTGSPAGWLAGPGADPRAVTVAKAADGAPALVLGSGGTPAVESYLVDLPAGAQWLQLRGCSQGDGVVTPTFRLFGPQGHITDRPADAVHRRAFVATTAAPADATRVAVALALTGGSRAEVSELYLRAVTPPPTPAVHVYANQVGYAAGFRKRAIVGTTFFPRDLATARFQVVDDRGRVVSSGPLQSLGRMHEGRPDDWGEYYWLADFSRCAEGRLRLRATVGGRSAWSHPFTVGEDAVFRGIAELTYRHFYYQRCGGEVPGWHPACHMDDARLPDGTHLDLTGGWHDAGDYNKWMHPVGPGLAIWGLASAYQAHKPYFDRLDRDGNGRADLLDEVLWGADWLLKMRNPKTGGLYGSVTIGWSNWSKAEHETDGRPGNADDRPALDEDQSVARAAAGLALASTFVADGRKYLDAAIALEQHAKAKEGNSPDRLCALLALWQATKDPAYLADAKAIADGLANSSPAGLQGAALGPLAQYVSTVPGAKADPTYRAALERSLAWLSRRQVLPFATSYGRGGPDQGMEQADRMAQWGRNMDLTSNVWAIAACARALDRPAVMQLAYNELDWLLGVNPLGICQVQGAGSRHPVRYHHRYSSYPGHRSGAVPGAIINGIGRSGKRLDVDLPYVDELYRDPTTDEPWIPYNGFLLCGLGQMVAR